MSAITYNQGNRRLVACLVALILAVLNPVSCLIHCHVLEHRTHAASGLAFFLCDHGDQAGPQALDGLTPLQPRALYELTSALFIPALLTIVLLRSIFLQHPASPLLRCMRPPVPPPRLTLP